MRFLVCGQSPYGATAQPGVAIPGASIPGSLPGTQPGSNTNLFQTIAGVEAYSFQFGNKFLRAQYTGADEITDIVDCGIAWGSASYRPVLNWCPWEEMQAYMRSWAVLNSAFPLWWSTQGDATNQVVYLWPPPVQAMEMEWDVIALPKNLYTDNDFEVLSENFAIAIKHEAAALAYMSTRPAQAQIHHAAFLDNLGVGRSASDYGKIPSMYSE